MSNKIMIARKNIANYRNTPYPNGMRQIKKLSSTPGVRLVFLFALSINLLSLVGCVGKSGEDDRAAQYYLPSGQIVISRPLPEPSQAKGQKMLGFMPVLGSHSGIWLSLNISKGSLEMMDGNRVLHKAKTEGGSNITPGSYQVLHKQTNPLWYAPDKYFVERGIKLPPEGDKSRFRRGALGQFAVFLNKETPIHSGPVWSDDVGGIRLSEGDLSKIYNQIQVGSIIEVK